MVHVLLFGSLAEAAGLRSVDLEGSTVDEILHAASSCFGDHFTRLLATSSVWVNGDDASADHHVREGDEVALLPPMSGG